MMAFVIISGIGSFFTFLITAIVIIAALGDGHEYD